MTHGSLFTGIDSFGEAAKVNGFTNVFGSEIDPYCRLMFEEKNPNSILFGDIRFINTLPYCDLLTFGFPCQDVSNAQTVKNYNPLENGNKTILFWEAIRLLRAMPNKPPFIVAENVNAIRAKGLEKVLEAFASCGYVCTYSVVPAHKFGAMHKRERVFIICHAVRLGWDTGLKVFNEVFNEGKKRLKLERQLYSSIYQGFQTETDSDRFRDYNGTTAQLFNGIMAKAIGNSIYYPVAEAIVKCIKPFLTPQS
jgi:DNA (cytosine-5)-methyltransferase 1